MNSNKLPISKLAVARVLVGGLLVAGLATPRSHAEPATTNAPATKPAAAGADQPSAREDAAKAIDEALLQRLYRFDIAASGVDRPNYLRRLTYDLAGRPPTKEEVRVFLADGSAESAGARDQYIKWLIAAGPTTGPTATQPADALVNWINVNKQPWIANDYLMAVRAATNEAKVKASYMGVGVDVPNETVRAQLKLPEGSGLVVNYVDADGPAKDLIRQHDVLQKLDDQLLINGAQLVTLVRMHKPGDTIQMTVIREAKPVTVPLKLAEKEVAPLSTYLSEQRGGGDPLVSATAAAPPPTLMKVLALRTVEARKAAQTINRVMPNDPANGGLNVVSDDRTNSLVVSGPAEAVKAVDDLVQKLDTPAAKDEAQKK
jgi:hypothetical protein